MPFRKQFSISCLPVFIKNTCLCPKINFRKQRKAAPQVFASCLDLHTCKTKSATSFPVCLKPLVHFCILLKAANKFSFHLKESDLKSSLPEAEVQSCNYHHGYDIQG